MDRAFRKGWCFFVIVNLGKVVYIGFFSFRFFVEDVKNLSIGVFVFGLVLRWRGFRRKLRRFLILRRKLSR